MPRRVAVSTQIESPGFRPISSPVDTFRRPTAGTGLAQLAHSLSGIAPELERFAAVHQQQEDEKSLLQAEQQFFEDAQALREASETFRDARASGAIQTHQDPIYRARYQELMGRHIGELAASEWQLVRQSELAEGVTLEEFDSRANDFLNDFEERNLGADIDEPALATAYRQTVRDAMMQDRRTYSAQAGARMIQKADERYYAEITSGVYNRIEAGFDVDELAGYLQLSLDTQLDLQDPGVAGPRRAAVRRRVNLGTAQGILAGAEQTALLGHNPRSAMVAVEALRKVTTAPGNTLADIQAVGDLINESAGRIFANIQRADTLASKEQDGAVNQIMSNAMVAISSGESLQPFIDQLATSTHPQAASRAQSLLNLQASVENAAERSEPEVVRALTDRIYAQPENWAANSQELLGALRARTLDPNTFGVLWNQGLNILAHTEGNGLFNDPVFRAAERNFRAVFGEGDLIPNGNNKLRLEQAHPLFMRSWESFMARNPDSTLTEKQDYLLQVSEGLQTNFPPEFNLSFSIVPKARWFTDLLVDPNDLRVVSVFAETQEVPRGDDLETLVTILDRAGVDLDEVDSPDDLALFIAVQQQLLDESIANRRTNR